MKYVIDGISTFILLFLGFISLAYGSNYYQILGSVLVFGFVYGLLFLIFNKKYRVYMNPIIAFCDLLSKKIAGKHFWAHVLAELIGTVLAAGAVFLMLLTSAQGWDIIIAASWVSAFANMTSINVTFIGALIFELIAAMLFVVLLVLIKKQCKTSKKQAMFMGMLVGLFLLCSFGITATGINPAKAFGPAVVYLFIGETALIVQFFVLCIADFIGALLGYFIANKIVLEKKKTKE